MKNILLLLFTTSVVFFSGCGDTKKVETVSIPGMKQVSIAIAGDSLTLFVPDPEIEKKPLVIEQKPSGATEITVGPNFQISIEEGSGDIALLKSDIAGDDVYKLQKFVKDEPKLLFWEVKILDMDGTKCHFYNIIEAGKSSYTIRDIETGESFSQISIQRMVDAAQTLKAKEAAAPDA